MPADSATPLCGIQASDCRAALNPYLTEREREEAVELMELPEEILSKGAHFRILKGSS